MNKTARWVNYRGYPLMALLIAVAILLMTGCEAKNEDKDGDVNIKTVTSSDTIITGSGADASQLYCLEFNTFSGVYVEDGKNEEVEDVAAILVENRSKAFLDRATITYKYGDKDAVFVLTGLPAGEKCWVMEQNKLQPDGKYSFEFVDCVTAFKEDAITATPDLTTLTKDNTITVENNSENKLVNVCVYYKNTFDDGNYFGGITYMIRFGDLEPGDSLMKESAHYDDTSEIVRYSYQIE